MRVARRPAGSGRYRKQPSRPRYGNIMHDKRVIRGSTYARTRKETAFRLAQQTAPAQQAGGSRGAPRSRGGVGVGVGDGAAPGNLAEQGLARPITPPPVEGRVHQGIQTRTYIEDLTKTVESVSVETQTEMEFDCPSEPLFEPKSSGKDFGTQIVDGDLEDFDLLVEPVLTVLISRCLEEAVMTVCEEEEIKEMQSHIRDVQQVQNTEMAALKRLQQRYERIGREINQNEIMVQRAREAKEHEMKVRLARDVTKNFFQDIEENALSLMQDNNIFHDPVKRQVKSEFKSYLLRRTEAKLLKTGLGQRAIDDMLKAASQNAMQQHLAADLQAYRRVLLNRERLRVLGPDDGRAEAAARISINDQVRLEARQQAEQRALAVYGSDAPGDSLDHQYAKIEREVEAQVAAEKRQMDREATEAVEAQLRQEHTAMAEQRVREEQAAAEQKRRDMEAHLVEEDPKKLMEAYLPKTLGFVVNSYVEPAQDGASESKDSGSRPSSRGGSGSRPSSGERTLKAGLVVGPVDPLGPACFAGIVEGDMIGMINRRQVSSPLLLSKALTGVMVGDVVRMQVRRVTTGKIERVAVEVGTTNPEWGLARVRDLRADAGLDVAESKLLDRRTAVRTLRRVEISVGAQLVDGFLERKNPPSKKRPGGRRAPSTAGGEGGGTRRKRRTKSVAWMEKVPVPGVRVEKLRRAGPLGDAELQVGDIITKVSAFPVDSEKSFIEVLSQYIPGDQVFMTALRAEASAPLGELPKTTEIRVAVTLGGKDIASHQVLAWRVTAGLAGTFASSWETSKHGPESVLQPGQPLEELVTLPEPEPESEY